MSATKAWQLIGLPTGESITNNCDLELRRSDVLDLVVTPWAPALKIDRRPHEIALADFDAAMAQDVVSYRANQRGLQS